jgi:hypothetical protein
MFPSSGLLRSIGSFRTDVSGLPIDLILKGQAWHLKMGPTGSPEMSVLKQPTLRINPEDGRFQFNRGESLRSRNF